MRATGIVRPVRKGSITKGIKKYIRYARRDSVRILYR